MLIQQKGCENDDTLLLFAEYHRGKYMELYIGIMSGTSADGIDIALVNFASSSPQLLASLYIPYSLEIRQRILALYQPGPDEIQRLGELDILLAQAFANGVNQFLKQFHFEPSDIKAIGSHGQTIRHSPNSQPAFTLQIGDPNTIAALTGITTIADFRRKDIAYGGQGAPLVPSFHEYALASAPKSNRVVINIGGIANITCLFDQHFVLGFDTGPGNALLDDWINYHLSNHYDKDGNWAAQGTVIANLLDLLLSDPYFKLPPPKSTGREYFNLAWLLSYINKLGNNNQHCIPVDVQATLVDLTAKSILIAIEQTCSEAELLVCGGGVHNAVLMQRLTELSSPQFSVNSTTKYGISPDWMEAMAFAWLAQQTMNGQPGNHPHVTGATQKGILGGIYTAP